MIIRAPSTVIALCHINNSLILLTDKAFAKDLTLVKVMEKFRMYGMLTSVPWQW